MKKLLKILLKVLIALVILVVVVLGAVKLVDWVAFSSFYSKSEVAYSMPGVNDGLVQQGFDYVEEDKVFLLSVKDYLKRFANYEELIFDNNSNKEQSQVIVLDNLNVVIPLKELIDVAKEKLRLTAELTKLQSEVERSNKMLNNPSFVSKAPAQKVEDEKAKLAKFIQQLKEVETLLESLKQYE